MDKALEYYNKVVEEADPKLQPKLDLLAKHKKLVALDAKVVEYRKAQNKGLISNINYEQLFQATNPNEKIKQQEIKPVQRRRRPPPKPAAASLADLY